MLTFPEILSVSPTDIQNAALQDLVLIFGVTTANLPRLLNVFALNHSAEDVSTVSLVPLNYQKYRYNREGGVVFALVPDAVNCTPTQQIFNTIKLVKMCHAAKTVRILLPITEQNAQQSANKLLQHLRYLETILPTLDAHLERLNLATLDISADAPDILTATIGEMNLQASTCDTLIFKLIEQISSIVQNENYKIIDFYSASQAGQILRQLDKLQAIKYPQEAFQLHFSEHHLVILQQQLHHYMSEMNQETHYASPNHVRLYLDTLKLLLDSVAIKRLYDEFNLGITCINETLCGQFNLRATRLNKLLDQESIMAETVMLFYQNFSAETYQITTVLKPYLVDATCALLNCETILTRYTNLIHVEHLLIGEDATCHIIDKLKMLIRLSPSVEQTYAQLGSVLLSKITNLANAAESSIHASMLQDACVILTELGKLVQYYALRLDKPELIKVEVDLKAALRQMYVKQTTTLLTKLVEANVDEMVAMLKDLDRQHAERVANFHWQHCLLRDDYLAFQTQITATILSRYHQLKMNINDILRSNHYNKIQQIKTRLLELKKVYQFIQNNLDISLDYQQFLKQYAMAMASEAELPIETEKQTVDALVAVKNRLSNALHNQAELPLLDVAKLIMQFQQSDPVIIADFAKMLYLDITDEILVNLRSFHFEHAQHANNLLKKCVFLDRYVDNRLFAKAHSENIARILTALQDHKKQILFCISNTNCVELNHLLTCYSFNGEFQEEIYFSIQAQILQCFTNQVVNLAQACIEMIAIPQCISQRDIVKLLFNKCSCSFELKSIFLSYYRQFQTQVATQNQIIDDMTKKIIAYHSQQVSAYSRYINNRQYYHAYTLAEHSNYFCLVFQRVASEAFTQLTLCNEDELTAAIKARLEHYATLPLQQYFEESPTTLYDDLQKLSEYDPTYYNFYKELKAIIIKAYETALQTMSTLADKSENDLKIVCRHALDLLPIALRPSLAMKYELATQSTSATHQTEDTYPSLRLTLPFWSINKSSHDQMNLGSQHVDRRFK